MVTFGQGNKTKQKEMRKAAKRRAEKIEADKLEINSLKGIERLEYDINNLKKRIINIKYDLNNILSGNDSVINKLKISEEDLENKEAELKKIQNE